MPDETKTVTTPQAVATATASGDMGLTGWLKLVANFSSMAILAGVACFLIWNVVTSLTNEVRELTRIATEQSHKLDLIQRDIEDIRRDRKMVDAMPPSPTKGGVGAGVGATSTKPD